MQTYIWIVIDNLDREKHDVLGQLLVSLED